MIRMKIAMHCLIMLSMISVLCLADSLQVSVQQKPRSYITLDGRLSGEEWYRPDSIYQFIQSQPQEGNASSEETKVKIMADSDNLFIAFYCYDKEPLKIQQWLSTRDLASGDFVTIYLSGIDDGETGYMFRLNAAGVQSDAIISNDGRIKDYSWNGIWYSSVLVDSSGWFSEFKIPYKTIRFTKGSQWKVGVARYIGRKNEASSWPAIKIQQGLRISKLAYLQGVLPNRPGLQLEVYPVALLRYDRIADRQYIINGGLNVSWMPMPNTRFEFAGNPDFAQIESDPDRINLSRYETYYNEKRPFFVEGSDKFSLPINLYYSRRIGNILPDGQVVPIYGAGKVMTSFGRYNLSLLGAICGKEVRWS